MIKEYSLINLLQKLHSVHRTSWWPCGFTVHWFIYMMSVALTGEEKDNCIFVFQLFNLKE